MILKKADLLADVVTSYDQTKTTIKGMVRQDTINSVDVLGPPLTKWLDVFTDTAGQTLAGVFYISHIVNSDLVRMFILTSEASGVASLLLYNFNIVTGADTYVGRINFSLPDVAATTHTYRGLVVMDSGTTGWKIFVNTTGSVAINGGLFLINNVDLADFIPIPVSPITYATGNDQKAVYFLQDPSNIGVGQLNIASVGCILDQTTSNVYVHNGVSATHQYYVYSGSTSPTYANVAGLAITAATDTVADAGHTYNNNDPVLITNLVGGTGLTNNTVYFVRNVVVGVSYQLSATSGGAAINITVDGTATIGRAFGTTGSNWLHKTGNLPALTGTLLAIDGEDFAQPSSGALSGFDCISFGTTTNIYMGKLSELTSGVTSWASLTTVNILGAVNEVTTPTAVTMNWEPSTERHIYTSNTSVFYVKPFVNNQIGFSFGGISTTYNEATSFDVYDFGAATVTGTEAKHGWSFLTSTTVGQRGVLACPHAAEGIFNTTYVITKVLDTENSQLRALETWEQLYDFTNIGTTYYRTSGFGSETGGWTALEGHTDLAAIATGSQIQFKFTFSISGALSSNCYQLSEVLYGLVSNTENLENVEYDHDNSNNGTPSRVSYRIKKAFTGSVPTLYFRAYDLSNALLVSHNTVTNPTLFEYSTDDGTSWNPLGTIPNTVGTRVRYTFTSPPGVDIRPSLKDE